MVVPCKRAPVPNTFVLVRRTPGGLTRAFLIPSLVPNSLVLVPLYRPKFHVSSQEKKSVRCCRFESLRDSGFIAQFLAFYRPNKTLKDI